MDRNSRENAIHYHKCGQGMIVLQARTYSGKSALVYSASEGSSGQLASTVAMQLTRHSENMGNEFLRSHEI